jgi:hypothetical protein
MSRRPTPAAAEARHRFQVFDEFRQTGKPVAARCQELSDGQRTVGHALIGLPDFAPLPFDSSYLPGDLSWTVWCVRSGLEARKILRPSGGAVTQGAGIASLARLLEFPG